MVVGSSAFQEGEEIPRRYTCAGDDVSPPLHIQDVPDAATSLVVIAEDPDAPSGIFVHWLLWNVPSRVEMIPKAIPATETVEGLAPAAQGTNDFGKIGYAGPCPPPGPPHRYLFRVFALDQTLSLDPGADRERLERAMEGHVLEEAVLTGTFGRKG